MRNSKLCADRLWFLASSPVRIWSYRSVVACSGSTPNSSAAGGSRFHTEPGGAALTLRPISTSFAGGFLSPGFQGQQAIGVVEGGFPANLSSLGMVEGEAVQRLQANSRSRARWVKIHSRTPAHRADKNRPENRRDITRPLLAIVRQGFQGFPERLQKSLRPGCRDRPLKAMVWPVMVRVIATSWRRLLSVCSGSCEHSGRACRPTAAPPAQGGIASPVTAR